jgi:hypothetical protein
MGIVLFSKSDCAKCTWLKSKVDLSGVTVYELGDADALAELAWHEGVTLAETSLPILVLDDGTKVTGVLHIKNYLRRKK